jgi:(E)-4-hydroxy-3-methylbut-2-enyl-diphosphate synthase
LTDDPVHEIAAARKILQALEIEGQCGLDIVSCPTCARTEIDLIPLVKRFEAAVAAEGLESVPVKVALMGCVVNGPGEARGADVGIAGGKGEAVLFRHGEIVEKIPERDIVERLLREVRAIKERKTYE